MAFKLKLILQFVLLLEVICDADSQATSSCGKDKYPKFIINSHENLKTCCFPYSYLNKVYNDCFMTTSRLLPICVDGNLDMEICVKTQSAIIASLNCSGLLKPGPRESETQMTLRDSYAYSVEDRRCLFPFYSGGRCWNECVSGFNTNQSFLQPQKTLYCPIKGSMGFLQKNSPKVKCVSRSETASGMIPPRSQNFRVSINSTMVTSSMFTNHLSNISEPVYFSFFPEEGSGDREYVVQVEGLCTGLSGYVSGILQSSPVISNSKTVSYFNATLEVTRFTIDGWTYSNGSIYFDQSSSERIFFQLNKHKEVKCNKSELYRSTVAMTPTKVQKTSQTTTKLEQTTFGRKFEFTTETHSTNSRKTSINTKFSTSDGKIKILTTVKTGRKSKNKQLSTSTIIVITLISILTTFFGVAIIGYIYWTKTKTTKQSNISISNKHYQDL